MAAGIARFELAQRYYIKTRTLRQIAEQEQSHARRRRISEGLQLKRVVAARQQQYLALDSVPLHFLHNLRRKLRPERRVVASADHQQLLRAVSHARHIRKRTDRRPEPPQLVGRDLSPQAFPDVRR